MNLFKNISIYALVLITQGIIYKLTGLINILPFQAQRMLDFSLPIDSKIPFIPEAIWPYSLYYIILISGFLMTSHRNFNHFIKSFIILSLFSDLMFVVIPVSMPLQVTSLATNNISSILLDYILNLDTRSNCFPSLHCAHSFLITYWFWISDRISFAVKILSLFMTLSVVFATVFVKQHWFIDIVGALILFIFIMRIYERKYQNQRI